MVAYFAVAMATAHGKPRVLGRKEKEKKRKKDLSLTFRRAATWMCVGGFACDLGCDRPLTY